MRARPAAVALVHADAADARTEVSSGMTGPAVDAEEAAIIARVQRGDREAFGVLVRRYSPRAYAVAYRVMRHSEDAQDLVQDAFVAALDGIATFDLARPFGPWLTRIVTYRGINARKSRSARERHVRVAPVEDADAAVAPPDAERAEIRERFAVALGALPDRQRTVVQLADVDGHTSQEIGRMLGISDGTVRWHLHTARATLRAALAPFRRKSDD
jgi:RNA polymerase sigma-70 factor (ECF subfamily)